MSGAALRYAPSVSPASQPLDAETMLCAIAVGEYAVAHTRAAYFEMGADPAIGLSRRIVDWLVREQLTQFSARDAFMRLRGTVRTMDGMAAPLRLLTTHGYIRERQVEHKRPGRKPSTVYEVNPHLYAHNAHNAQNTGPAGNCAHSAHCAWEIGI